MSVSDIKIGRALLSVSDKTGIVEFAKALSSVGVELISTGGTANALRDAGLEVHDISQFTEFPEMMDGRVKTLHPKVHGALLAIRGNKEHESARHVHDIPLIDLVVINLYPFESTIAGNADFDTAIENIDIGGPAMIRSAAKNHSAVTVVTEPEDYSRILDEMKANGGGTSEIFRRELAAKAYARTAAYDSVISEWFAAQLGTELPERMTFQGKRAGLLRYGENPHQKAAFYANGQKRAGVATAEQAQGKQLSYNNLNDTDAAYELVAEFDVSEGPAIAIIKHANPCGVARGKSLESAYQAALACDPVSAFGGIIAANQPLDEASARAMIEIFTEVIIAPDASRKAREIIASKKNLRLLLAGNLPDPRATGINVKALAGGLLVQSRDNGVIKADDLRIVTKRAPSEQELADLVFASKVAKHVKSNAIIYVKSGATVGIGAGQMSRIDSARIAARKAKDAANGGTPATHGSVVASDAFFPFADGLLAAAEAGATAVIQPGGSMRDEEVIAAADKAGLAMVFTGMRHFRH